VNDHPIRVNIHQGKGEPSLPKFGDLLFGPIIADFCDDYPLWFPSVPQSPAHVASASDINTYRLKEKPTSWPAFQLTSLIYSSLVSFFLSYVHFLLP
jgi:hypothetical protein